MTAANWAALIPAIIAVLGAGAAYLKSRTAVKTAKSANTVVQNHVNYGDHPNGN